MSEPKYWHGLVAAAAATVVSNPFELVKLRQQTSHHEMHTHAWRQVMLLRSPGWPRCHLVGSGWTMVRALTYSPLTLYLNGFLLRHNRDGHEIGIVDRAAAGAVSGAVGALVCNPIEVLRVRRQSNVLVRAQRLALTAFTAGMGANVLRCSLWAGTQLSVYGWLDSRAHSKDRHNQFLWSVMIAGISTLAAVCVGHPFDTIKSRQMVSLTLSSAGAGSYLSRGFGANVCRSLIHGTVLLTIHRTLAHWSSFD